MLGYSPEEFAQIERSEFVVPEVKREMQARGAGLREGLALPAGLHRGRFIRKDATRCEVEYQISELRVGEERIGRKRSSAERGRWGRSRSTAGCCSRPSPTRWPSP
jgi:hypothetical protein